MKMYPVLKTYTIACSLLTLAFLSGCQKGDLSGLDDESIISTLDLVSISVSVQNPVTPIGGPIPGPIMPVGRTQQFNITGTKNSGDPVNPPDLNSSVEWSVSDITLATINSDGLLTALVEGAITVTATLGSLPAATTVINTSTATVNSISISTNDSNSPNVGEIRLCQLMQLKAEALYEDVSDTSIKFNWDITNDAVWTSADTDTYIDTNTKGLVAFAPVDTRPTTTPVTTINAAFAGATPGILELNVLYTTTDFTTLTIDRTISQLSPGTSAPLIATATRSSPTTTDSITTIADWSSNATSIVSVVPNTGVVTGGATGGATSATITATCGGESDSLGISLADTNKLERIEITANGNTDPIYTLNRNSTTNNSIDLAAKAYYTTGNPTTIIETLTPKPVWTMKALNLSPNTTAATSIVTLVSNTGKVTAGTTTGIVLVTLDFDGKSDDIVIIVEP